MSRLLLIAIIGAGVAIGLLAPARDRRPVPPPSPAATAPAPPGVVGRPAATVLTRASSGHFYAEALVDGRPVRLVVDTGATGIALTPADARALGIAVDPARFEPVGTGANGPVRGQRVRVGEVAVDGKRASDLDALVVENLPVSLLGQDYLRTLESVEIRGDTMTLR